MYVTRKTLRDYGLAKSDVPTGFCRKSTFSKNFDDVVQARARSALAAIDGTVKSLVKDGTLPSESRTSARGISGDGKVSFSYAYIELEKGREYLVMQVDVTPGTLYNPKGIISAFTSQGEFRREFVAATLEDIEHVKVKIAGKLKEYRAAHANEARPEGAQAVGMMFAEGFF
ncbi:MAG: hypothetical protein WC263_04340 [Candidatus Micrarchaeia archaeon]|jgi:hypothetical protein